MHAEYTPVPRTLFEETLRTVLNYFGIYPTTWGLRTINIFLSEKMNNSESPSFNYEGFFSVQIGWP
jgi:hypothetical protein